MVIVAGWWITPVGDHSPDVGGCERNNARSHRVSLVRSKWLQRSKVNQHVIDLYFNFY
jgi:hypothetical protein